MRIKHGMLIALEGVDGCGKSTTISWLMHLANRHHIANTYAKETKSTNFGRIVRNIILKAPFILSKSEQATLFAMARNDCLKQIIIPALKQNELVICDRYLLSSMAYQAQLIKHKGKLIDTTHVADINKTLLGYDWTLPTIYFYVNLPVQQNVARLSQRHRKLDRIDQKLTHYSTMLNLKYRYHFAMQTTSVPVVELNGAESYKQRGGVAFTCIWQYIRKHHLATFKKHW